VVCPARRANLPPSAPTRREMLDGSGDLQQFAEGLSSNDFKASRCSLEARFLTNR
jgi:hypothetical protein